MRKTISLALIIILVSIISVGTVSAFNFDNVKDYNEDEKKLTITNLFGLGSEIASIQLNTPLVYNVMRGNNVKVAEFTIDNKKDFNDVFNNLELYDKKRNNNELDRQYIYRYKTYEEVTVPEYNNCNSFPCTQTGSHTKQVEVWNDFDKKAKLKKGEITIGIFTDVKAGDYVEWIPTFYGNIRVEEWAVWNETFSDKLLAYYNFDEGTGTTLFERGDGIYNGEIINGANWTDGLINKSLVFDDDDSQYVNINNTQIHSSSNFTISIWVNTSTYDNDHNLLYKLDGNTGYSLDNNGAGIDLNIGTGSTTHTIFHPTTGNPYNTWAHVVVTYNGTAVSLYHNGTLAADNEQTFSNSRLNWTIGSNQGVSLFRNGSVDELAFWNKSLTADEVATLFAAGVGIPYNSSISDSTITLNTPANDASSLLNVIFNCSASDIIGLVNVTFFLNDVENLSIANTTANQLDLSFQTSIDFGTNGSRNWSCSAEDSSSNVITSATRDFSISSFVINSASYNGTSYQTSTESYILNVSSKGIDAITAAFVFNGTSYAATKTGNNSGTIFTNSLDIDTVGNSTFYWAINKGGAIENTANYSQWVNPLEFHLCNTTSTISYINFSFKDEYDSSVINASIDASTFNYWLGDGGVSKQLLFTNLTNNFEYNFCLDPGNQTLHNNISIQYSKTGYPQRRWTSTVDLTNISLQKTLYLLATADGTYSVYQVQTNDGTPIEGVSVTVERQFSGAWTIVEQGTTDSAGAVTFWLNSDFDHRLVFTKTSYTSQTIIVRPSSSIYTVVMGTSDTSASYTSSILGIKYWFSPGVGRLDKDTVYNFNLNVTANQSNLVNCRVRLLDSAGALLNSTAQAADSTTECNLWTSLNTSAAEKIFGEFSIDTGSGYFVIDSDAYWLTNITNYGTGGIWKALDGIRNLEQWGDESNRAEFSRVVGFFFFIAIILSMLSFFLQGWEMASPGANLFLLWIFFFFGSATGFLELSGLTTSAKFDKWFVFAIASLFTWGYVIGTLRRTT